MNAVRQILYIDRLLPCWISTRRGSRDSGEGSAGSDTAGAVPSVTAATLAVEAVDGAARAGTVTTAHGRFTTPCFMPVGTRGAVRLLDAGDLDDLGPQVVLANTYHLTLRPGVEVVEALGGLHRFTGWDGHILTDSGGFQVFSLARLRKITEEGVHFQNHLDGTPMFLWPREAMETQARKIASEIADTFALEGLLAVFWIIVTIRTVLDRDKLQWVRVDGTLRFDPDADTSLRAVTVVGTPDSTIEVGTEQHRIRPDHQQYAARDGSLRRTARAVLQN